MDINLVWDPARGVNFQEYEGDKATAKNAAKAAKATGANAAADKDASEKATARHVSDAGFLSYPDEGLSEAERAAVMSFATLVCLQSIDEILGT